MTDKLDRKHLPIITPKRRFKHSLWVVDITFDWKGNVETETFLHSTYEGARKKMESLIRKDKQGGITPKYLQDVKDDFGDSWDVKNEANIYKLVEHGSGSYEITIQVYEQRVHQ